ncbi:hypothetical protein ACHAWF_014346 [Thalassiosira exigua]
MIDPEESMPLRLNYLELQDQVVSIVNEVDEASPAAMVTWLQRFQRTLSMNRLGKGPATS